MEISLSEWHIGLLIIITTIPIVFLVLYFRIYNLQILHRQQEAYQQELKHQQELLERTLQTQEDERHRIAGQVHDALGNQLAVMSLWLKNPESFMTENFGNKLSEHLNQIIQNSRDISHELFPVKLKYDGLLAGIQSMFEKIKGGYCTNITIHGAKQELSPNANLHIYRIIQEFLNNTLKHAQASVIDLTIKYQKENVYFLLYDNGKGFDQKKREAGFGTHSIYLRANIIHASIKIKSTEGKGTRLILAVGLQDKNKEEPFRPFKKPCQHTHNQANIGRETLLKI